MVGGDETPPVLIRLNNGKGPLVGIDLRPDTNGRTLSPVTHRLIETWARGVKAMEQILDETTLADLCKPEAQALMYYI